MATEIKTTDKFNEAIDGDKLVVVEFFNTSCGPSVVGPLVDKYSTEGDVAEFFRLDVEQFPEIGKKYDVSTVPHFTFFIKSEDADELVKPNKNQLENVIQKFI